MGLEKIFWPAFSISRFSKYDHILGQTHRWRPQAPAWQASPWKHSPSSSAPCAVPMRLSRIEQHTKEEPCAKQRALLGVFSSRYSRVSRGVRSAWSSFSCSSLVVPCTYHLYSCVVVMVVVMRERRHLLNPASMICYRPTTCVHTRAKW
jgi:hypothetical protein